MEHLKDISYGEARPGDVLAYHLRSPEMVHLYVLLDKQPAQITKDFTCSTLTVLHISQSIMGDLGEVLSYPVDDEGQTYLFHRPAC